IVWTTRLWAEAIYRINRAIVHCGATIGYRYIDLNCCRTSVAERIGDLKCNRIHASIKVAIAFAPQLDRLAIRSNHDVIESCTVSATQIVLQLVAAHLLNDDTAGHVVRITTCSCTRHEV